MTTAYDVVKRHYEASDRGDLDGMMADIGPETRWTEAEGFPCAGTYVGREAIIQGVFVVLGDKFDGFSFTLERLLDAGTTAIGLGSYKATSKETGKSFTARVAHVWDVKNGKVTRFEQFTDTAIVANAMR